MSGTSDVDRIEVEFIDDAVDVGVDKAQSRAGAPMSQKAIFDMLDL